MEHKFIYKDHLEKFKELAKKTQELRWKALLSTNAENMENKTVSTPTLNERIKSFVFGENYTLLADNASVIVDINKAANSIEKLVLSEQLALLEDLRQDNLFDSKRVCGDKIKNKITELTNKLNQL